MLQLDPESLILALDPASKTGFCAGTPSQGFPISGTVRVKFPGEEMGQEGDNIGDFLESFCRREKPKLVVYERPIPIHALAKGLVGGRGRSEESILIPIHLTYVIGSFCRHYEIPCVSVTQQTVRTHFLGQGVSGRAKPKEDDIKLMVFERCKALGYLPPDAAVRNKTADPILDRADAISVWDWACVVHGRRAPKELHLFGETAA